MRLPLFAGVFVLVATVASAQAPLPSSVKTVEIKSDSVGRTLKYDIVLPAKYETSTDRYPVIYLLHGYSGNYHNYSRMNAPKHGQENDVIIVMPDGGNSWYANWASSDEGQKNNWDDFITKDLINHIDSTYRTIAKREGRAINGLSMGGFGALTLGLRHPDLFISIGTQSGAIGFARGISDRIKKGDDLAKAAAQRKLADTPNESIGVEDFDSQLERTPKGKLFTTAEEADAYDPFKIVLNVPKDKLPHIIIDCGTDDGLIKANQEFAKILMDNKIPFTYAESAGGHNAAYWSREIGAAIAVQTQVMKRNLAKLAAEAKPATP